MNRCKWVRLEKTSHKYGGGRKDGQGSKSKDRHALIEEEEHYPNEI